jgi:hypothetical protein
MLQASDIECPRELRCGREIDLLHNGKRQQSKAETRGKGPAARRFAHARPPVKYVIGSGAPAPPPHHSPREPRDAKRYLIVAAPAMHTTSSCEPVAPEQPIAPMILLSSTSGIPPREAMTSSSVPI